MRVFLLIIILLAGFYGNVSAVGSEATSSSKDRSIKRLEAQERVSERKMNLQEKIEERREEIQEKINIRKEALKEKFEERKEKLATKAAEIKRRIAERRKALIRNHFERMLRRFQAAIARFKRIAGRIERRLDKMEVRGIDVASLRADLVSAREDIEVAEGLLEGLGDKLETVLTDDDPKSAFEEVRDIVHEAREMLKDIHGRLVDIIVEMKGKAAEAGEGEVTVSPTATPSASTE